MLEMWKGHPQISGVLYLMLLLHKIKYPWKWSSNVHAPPSSTHTIVCSKIFELFLENDVEYN